MQSLSFTETLTVFPVKVMFQFNTEPLQLSVTFSGTVLLKQLCSASANALTASDAYADTLYRSTSSICPVFCMIYKNERRMK